jgi:hypothetical protein
MTKTIIIIITGKYTISFTQGIYTNIPETNHVQNIIIIIIIITLGFCLRGELQFSVCQSSHQSTNQTKTFFFANIVLLVIP